MVIVSQLTAVGATFCYLLSAHFAKPFVERYYGEHLLRLKRAVCANICATIAIYGASR